MFVVEELTRSVTPRLLVATLVTSAIAVAEMRALLGNVLDFLVSRAQSLQSRRCHSTWLPEPCWGCWACIQRHHRRLLDLFQWVQRLPAVLPAAMVGLVVGLLAWFAPSFVGGGDSLIRSESLLERSGAGLGASHRTGWPGLIAKLIDLFRSSGWRSVSCSRKEGRVYERRTEQVMNSLELKAVSRF